MIRDPVQRGVAEGEVGNLMQIEVVQRRLAVAYPAPEFGLEVLTRRFEHICRAIDGDHMSER